MVQNSDLKDERLFSHLMLDLETMGTKSNSAIISIGAVEFDILTGKTGREFYRNVSLQSCISLKSIRACCIEITFPSVKLLRAA